MESTSERNRIQISQETADILKSFAKDHWLIPRENAVTAKGKGMVRTYWLNTATRLDVESVGTSANSQLDDDSELEEDLQDKIGRIIGWNTETLLKLLKQIVARRNAGLNSSVSPAKRLVLKPSKLPLEEVKEIIELPEFDVERARRQEDPESIVIPEDVVDELRAFVTCIADMYNDNPFHNFEHASHVTMSVIKLLSRIVAPSEYEAEIDGDGKKVAASLHDHTYGITSDPLTQFACAFSALIHDVDHVGVPNAQLVKEGQRIASVYKNRSVAEQNSLDLSWNLLMEDRFSSLRSALFATESELKRFRELVVNSVMATDLTDKELKALRNDRWEKAFSSKTADNPRDADNRKATIVIEHLIQASDISHTMQHVSSVCNRLPMA